MIFENIHPLDELKSQYVASRSHWRFYLLVYNLGRDKRVMLIRAFLLGYDGLFWRALFTYHWYGSRTGTAVSRTLEWVSDDDANQAKRFNFHASLSTYFFHLLITHVQRGIEEDDSVLKSHGSSAAPGHVPSVHGRNPTAEAECIHVTSPDGEQARKRKHLSGTDLQYLGMVAVHRNRPYHNMPTRDRWGNVEKHRINPKL